MQVMESWKTKFTEEGERLSASFWEASDTEKANELKHRIASLTALPSLPEQGARDAIAEWQKSPFVAPKAAPLSESRDALTWVDSFVSGIRDGTVGPAALQTIAFAAETDDVGPKVEGENGEEEDGGSEARALH